MKPGDVRNAFRRAEGGESPRVDRLVDAVPSLIDRARSRPSAPASWWPSVPRLAAVTALAVIVAVVMTLTSEGSAVPTAFERVMLGTGGSSGTGDLLLDAVLDAGRDDG